MPLKVAVVGAGISGLSAAHELQRAGCDVTVFEKEPCLGGRMATRCRNGLRFDIGADHLCNLYVALKASCREFGIPFRMVAFLRYGLFRDGRVVPTAKAVGWPGRVRLALQSLGRRKVPDFFDLSGAVPFDTDNAYDHMRRKAGREVADYLVDGFTSTYQFHRAREISRGALQGILDSIRHDEADWPLHHMEGGMGALPEALGQRLDVRLGQAVERVQGGDGAVVDGERYDACILASTANASLRMLAHPTAGQEELLRRTEYASTISVSFRVEAAALPETAIVWVPHAESGAISGYVNESMKGGDVLCDGKTLLNTWLHDAFARQLIGQDDEAVFRIVKTELLKVCPWFGAGEELEPNDLQRWPQAMPKFSHGHLTRVDRFLQGGQQGRNQIYLCGDYLNSPWVEGSIRCGQRTARQLMEARR